MYGHASGWTFQRATAIGTKTSAPKRIRFHSAWMNAAARTMASVATVNYSPCGSTDDGRHGGTATADDSFVCRLKSRRKTGNWPSWRRLRAFDHPLTRWADQHGLNQPNPAVSRAQSPAEVLFRR